MSHIAYRHKHPTIKIGLISDTHGRLSDSVHDVFNGTDLIIHAGDVGKPEILQRADMVIRGVHDITVEDIISNNTSIGGTL